MPMQNPGKGLGNDHRQRDEQWNFNSAHEKRLWLKKERLKLLRQRLPERASR
jgi:hypothetical protein